MSPLLVRSRRNVLKYETKSTPRDLASGGALHTDEFINIGGSVFRVLVFYGLKESGNNKNVFLILSKNITV